MSEDFGILKKDNTALLVVDVQQGFRKAIADFESMVSGAKKLVEGFNVLGLPVMVTEQYPRGLGETVSELKDVLGGVKPFEKTCFNCFDEQIFEEAMRGVEEKNLVIAGIEAHVCVLSTVLSAMKRGYTVHVAVDAVSSRGGLDKKTAVERMKQSGAYVTTSEAVLFQLLGDARDPDFKKIQGLVR
ncbi:MAG: isochorismatase family protein [Candidatus Altiarchaeales archaeon]|nr:isochorismatase family protein [Candidatus Altiarchaeales archaeon]